MRPFGNDAEDLGLGLVFIRNKAILTLLLYTIENCVARSVKMNNKHPILGWRSTIGRCVLHLFHTLSEPLDEDASHAIRPFHDLYSAS